MMKSTTKTLVMAILFAVMSLFTAACYKDLNCRDESIGDIFLESSTKLFFPLDTAKTLIFKNAAGEEMGFICPHPYYANPGISVELKCFEINLTSSFKYVNSEYIELPYYQDSIYAENVEFRMAVGTRNAEVKEVGNTSFYDFFTATYGFQSAATVGGMELFYITDDRDTDAGILAEVPDAGQFREILDTTILGKNFPKLIAAVPSFGEPEDSKYAFYYQPKMGPAAFSLKDGTVYVFDRAE